MNKLNTMSFSCYIEYSIARESFPKKLEMSWELCGTDKNGFLNSSGFKFQYPFWWLNLWGFIMIQRKLVSPTNEIQSIISLEPSLVSIMVFFFFPQNIYIHAWIVIHSHVLYICIFYTQYTACSYTSGNLISKYFEWENFLKLVSWQYTTKIMGKIRLLQFWKQLYLAVRIVVKKTREKIAFPFPTKETVAVTVATRTPHRKIFQIKIKRKICKKFVWILERSLWNSN